MIFADASAIVAIIAGEPEAEDFLARLLDEAGEVYVSSMVRFEAVSALAKFRASRDRRPVEPRDFQHAQDLYADLLRAVQAKEVPIDQDMGLCAVQAAQAYGKLVRHPARLNMGDCFAHACARSLGAALLYKGDDFARTDLA